MGSTQCNCEIGLFPQGVADTPHAKTDVFLWRRTYALRLERVNTYLLNFQRNQIYLILFQNSTINLKEIVSETIKCHQNFSRLSGS